MPQSVELPEGALHTLIAHVPVGLGLGGLVLMGLCMASRRVRRPVRAVTAVLYLTAAACGWLALRSGLDAVDRAPGNLTDEALSALRTHEAAGRTLIAASLAAAIGLFLGGALKGWIRKPGMAAAIVGSALAAVMASGMSRNGLELVREYGVGTDSPEVKPLIALNLETDPAEWAGDVADPGDIAQEIEAKVLPILEERCMDCHNVDRRRGGLNLEQPELWKARSEHYERVIVPGDPEASPLLAHVRGTALPRMPKGERPLDDEEIAAIEAWIAQKLPDVVETQAGGTGP